MLFGWTNTYKVPMRKIDYPRSNGNSIGGGATNIYDNVVTTGIWTWDDVKQFEFCQYGDLQLVGPRDSQSTKDKLKTVKQNVPNMIILSRCRQDLWWGDDWPNGGPGTWNFPSRAWGTIVSNPTFAMGETPRNGDAWSTAQSALDTAGWTQDAANATANSSGTLLTNPYEIGLKTAGKIWRVRQNRMNVFDDDWLDLYTDNLAAQFALEPYVDGFYVQPQKLQAYSVTGASDQFHKWVEGDLVWDPVTETYVPWNINTNNPPWISGENSVAELYDDPDSKMDECIEGSIKLVDMLRDKVPNAFLMYAPYNLTVVSWRNTQYRNDYRTWFVLHSYHPGGTNEAADDYWRDELTRMSHKCDAIEFYEDDHPSDFSAQWAADTRIPGQWCAYTEKPQEIVTGLPQPLEVVEVSTMSALKSALQAAQPGTHVVLTQSINVGQAEVVNNINGTQENPIVLRGAAGVKVNVTSWSGGIHGATIGLHGHWFWVADLEFDGGTLQNGGRLLNINSTSIHGPSEDVTVFRCVFRNSWNHAGLTVGNRITTDNCQFYNNGRRNLNGLLGSWPYNWGSWDWDNNGTWVLSNDITIKNCLIQDAYIEGIGVIFTDGAVIENNTVGDCRYVAIFVHSTRNAVVRDNTVTSTNPILTQFGNPMRGLRIANEPVQTGQPDIEASNIVVTDNSFDGGTQKVVAYTNASGDPDSTTTYGLRNGFTWTNHPQNPTPNNRYSDFEVRRNTVVNTNETVPHSFAEQSGGVIAPANCVTDFTQTTEFEVDPADSSAWTFE